MDRLEGTSETRKPGSPCFYSQMIGASGWPRWTLDLDHNFGWQKTWTHQAKNVLPSGKLTVCYDKSPFFIGKSTVNDHFQYLCYVFLKITRGFPILHHQRQCWGSPFPSPAAIGAPPHMPRWLHCRPWRFLLASEILWHWTSLQIFHGVFLGRWYNIYIYWIFMG